MPDIPKPEKSALRRNAYIFIILMGVVSLLGDYVYEGGRSVAGPYLAFLGASSIAVGFAAGFGEFIGYGLRLTSGYLADKSAQYWTFLFIGYGLIIAIPVLAIAGHWQIAAMLYIAERMGKALRAPSRDVLLSSATKQVGRGWGFGIHEAMDQIGAFAGPLTFTAIFILNGGYKSGFAILLLPAVLCIAVLALARWKFPHPEDMEGRDRAYVQEDTKKSLQPIFWYYCAFTLLIVIAFTSFPLMSYHWHEKGVVSDTVVPVYYAIAMGVDALVALAVGKLYDRYGLSTLTVLPAFTLPIPFLAFTGRWDLALMSIVLWGAAMGVHETIMRAAIADLTHLRKRGTGYGIFNAVYGAGMFAGAIITGVLYSWNINYIMAFITVMVIASLPALYLVKKHCPAAGQGEKC